MHHSKICWKLQERYICRFVCLYFDRCWPLFNNIHLFNKAGKNIVKFLKYFLNISWNISRNISGQKFMKFYITSGHWRVLTDHWHYESKAFISRSSPVRNVILDLSALSHFTGNHAWIWELCFGEQKVLLNYSTTLLAFCPRLCYESWNLKSTDVG